MVRMQRKALVIKTVGLAVALLCLTSCALHGPPNIQPQQPDSVSLDPQNWYIYYSGGLPPHPSPDASAAWSLDFPSFQDGGHVNYVETPFRASTNVLHNVHISFVVQSDAPKYHVMDETDKPPATVHVFFEQQNDNLVEPNGRWWADPSKYNLGSDDNDEITMTIPLTPASWTNVYSKSDSKSFYESLQNVGWIGVTFGGQDFWGHGVALTGGTSKFVLKNMYVD